MPRAGTTYSFLDGYINRETEKAIHFNVAQAGHVLDGETFWFPISQIKSIYRAEGNEPDRIQVADWLIEAKANDIAGFGNGGDR
jgi:hypothetical protein